MIRIIKFSIKRGKRNVFHHAQATFPSRGVMGITGPSGVGKTTFFQSLLHLIPFEGLIQIYGQSWKHLLPQEKEAYRRTYFGWIAQDFPLFMTKSIQENLLLIAQIRGFVLIQESQIEVFRVLRLFDITSWANRLLNTLSGGQRQKVALAASLIGSPPIIIADEPFAHLDEDQEKQTLALLKEQSKQHLILISSHHLTTLKQYADEILTMTSDFRFHSTNPDPVFTSGGRIKRASKFPFHAVWSLIQSMRLHSNLSRWLEGLFVFIVLLLGTLMILMRMIPLHIQDAIASRLGDQLQTVEISKIPESPLPIPLDQFHALQQQIHMPSLIWGTMVRFDFTLLSEQQAYLIRDDQMITFPFLDSSTFTQVVLPHEVNVEVPISLSLHEVILGLTPYQYEWAMRFFHTDDLPSYLYQHPIKVLLRVAQPSWGYEDEVLFDWVGVHSTPQPVIIHANPNFAYALFHDLMQYPIASISPSNHPLAMEVFPFVSVLPKTTLVSLYSYFLDQGLLLNHVREGDHVLCSVSESCFLPRYLLMNKPYDLPQTWLDHHPIHLPLSPAGLFRMEEAFMYGFQKKMYLAFSKELLEQVQELTTIEKITSLHQVVEFPGLFTSYAFAPSASNVLWKPSNIQEGVRVSKSLKPESSEDSNLYFLFLYHSQQLGDGFIKQTYRMGSLPITQWFPSSQKEMLIHPNLLESLLRDQIGFSSSDLFPTGFVVNQVDPSVNLPSSWKVSNGLAQTQAVTHQLMVWMGGGSAFFGFITAMPLVGLLLLLYDVKAKPLIEKGHILIRLGLPSSSLTRVFQTEVTLMFLRWLLPMISGLLFMTWVIHSVMVDLGFYSGFYLPWLEILFILLGLVGLQSILTWRFNRQMAKVR